MINSSLKKHISHIGVGSLLIRLKRVRKMCPILTRATITLSKRKFLHITEAYWSEL